MTRRLKPLYYKKAMAQQEKGGKTWRVITDLYKRIDGKVFYEVYEPNLPSKERAKRIASVLNNASFY